MKSQNQLVYDLDNNPDGIGRFGMLIPRQVFESAMTSVAIRATVERLSAGGGWGNVRAIELKKGITQTTIRVNDNEIGKSVYTENILSDTLAMINGIDIAAHINRMPDPRLSARFDRSIAGGYGTNLKLAWPESSEVPSSHFTAIARWAIIATGARLGYDSEAKLSDKVAVEIDEKSRSLSIYVDKEKRCGLTTYATVQHPSSRFAQLTEQNISRRQQQYLGMVGATAMANSLE